MMFLVFVMTVILGVTSSYWVMMWISLEINMMMMCNILSKEGTNPKISPPLLYYIVQVLSSLMVMLSFIFIHNEIYPLIMFLGGLMKMGSWPMQFWYIKVIKILGLNYKSILIMTIQKILPTMIIISSFSYCSNKLAWMMLAMGLFTFFISIPTLINIKTLDTSSVMVLSSINSNGWSIFSGLCSFSIFLMFLAMYSLSVIAFILMFYKVSMKNGPPAGNLWLTLFTFSMLGGIPPFLMFWAKLTVIKHFMECGVPLELSFIIILSSCAMLYVYMNVALLSSTLLLEKNNFYKLDLNKKVNLTTLVMVLTSLLGFLLVYSLDLTKGVYLDSVK